MLLAGVIGQKEGAALDHQDSRLRPDRQHALREGQGTKAGADDDVVELLFLAHPLPSGFRQEEHVIHHLLRGGDRGPGAG